MDQDELNHTAAAVRAYIYRAVIADGSIPSGQQAAQALGLSRTAIARAFEHLAAERLLVLQPESREVLMAQPFSSVPTPFRVSTSAQSWSGNCIWDALGILAMLGADGRIAASCPDCGEALHLKVEGGQLAPSEGIVHFAVPAARWWDDIVYT